MTKYSNPLLDQNELFLSWAGFNKNVFSLSFVANSPINFQKQTKKGQQGMMKLEHPV